MIPKLTKGINYDCKHYPCHKDLEDCTFCYCPLYPCENGDLGKWLSGRSSIWDCSNCTYIHKSSTVKLLYDCIEYYGKEYEKLQKMINGED